jgi:hypothetical protein
MFLSSSVFGQSVQCINGVCFQIGARDSDGAIITSIGSVSPRAPEAPLAMESRTRKTSRIAILEAAQKAFDQKQIDQSQLRSIRLASMMPRMLAKMESLIAEKAYVEGYAIPMGSDGEPSVKAIDWNSLADFIERIIPLILKLIDLFG